MQRAIPEGVTLLRYAAQRSRLFHMTGACEEPSAAATPASLSGPASPAEPCGEKQRSRTFQRVDQIIRLDVSVLCRCDLGFLSAGWTFIVVVLRLHMACLRLETLPRLQSHGYSQHVVQTLSMSLRRSCLILWCPASATNLPCPSKKPTKKPNHPSSALACSYSLSLGPNA